MLAEGQDDECGKQWTHCRAAIAAHLEDGLRQTLLAARSQLCHSRSGGVEDRRTQSNDAHSQEYEKIVLGEGEQHQTHQGEAHTHRKGVRPRMLVSIKSREGLQDGGGHLKHQGDDAYLCKREVELVLHDGINGGDDGLDHIVEEMRDAADDEHRIHRALHHRGVTLQLVAYGFDIHCLLLVIFRAKVQNILQILDESSKICPKSLAIRNIWRIFAALKIKCFCLWER